MPPRRTALLEAAGVKVWFSEKDLGLGVPMMRAIDKGLAASRIGLVLVTPALLARLPKESVADKELSALLAGNRLVPIVHNTTYEALRNVSPLLASRSGLDTAEDSMAVIATKISELVALQQVEALARKGKHLERMRSCILAGAKKQPPEMSITGGWNPPNDKGGGGTVGGGKNQIIRCRVRLLCTLAYIEAR